MFVVNLTIFETNFFAVSNVEVITRCSNITMIVLGNISR